MLSHRRWWLCLWPWVLFCWGRRRDVHFFCPRCRAHLGILCPCSVLSTLCGCVGDSSGCESAVLKTQWLFLSSYSTSWVVPSSRNAFCRWFEVKAAIPHLGELVNLERAAGRRESWGTKSHADGPLPSPRPCSSGPRFTFLQFFSPLVCPAPDVGVARAVQPSEVAGPWQDTRSDRSQSPAPPLPHLS